jgi:hypothetical protein
VPYFTYGHLTYVCADTGFFQVLEDGREEKKERKRQRDKEKEIYIGGPL